MKVLFLGGIFGNDIEDDILEKSKGTVHYAANKLQWNLVEGISQVDNLSMEILSAPFIGTFPKDYTSIKYKGKNSNYKDSINITYVGFNNTWGYRNISRKNNLVKGIKRFANSDDKDKIIIVYSPHTPFLQAAVYAKKIDPKIHICLVVPDLPQFMNLNEKRSKLYDTLKKIDINIFNKNSSLVDSFVLLTEPMKDILNVNNRPYTVVEGMVNSDKPKHKMDDNLDCLNNIKSVLYTGTLNKKFGVINLVEAFSGLEIDNIKLQICGRGDSEDTIKEYASKDKRIEYLGQISNEEAVLLQKNATILVNPRQNNEEFTKYSFPSKNMEYLLTGRPVIAYKLDGIPDEYDDYFYYVEDDTVYSLAKKIQEVLQITDKERNVFGERARNFVLKNKNNAVAAKRIIDMIQRNRSR